MERAADFRALWLSDDELVSAWREHELERAGYPTVVAIQLAADSTVDLHVACDLVRRGCPADIALRILLS